LQSLIRATLQEQLGQREEGLQRLADRVESLESHIHQESVDISERLDNLSMRLQQKSDIVTMEAQVKALQLNLIRKADISEFVDRLDALDGKVQRKAEAVEVDKRLEAIDQRFLFISNQKADAVDVDEKIVNINVRLQQKADASEMDERLSAVEQRLQHKPDTGYVDSQVGMMHQVMQRKVDCVDVNEKLEDIKQRLRLKAESIAVDEQLSVLQQRLHRKAEAADVQERLESLDQRLEQKVNTVDVVERLDAVDRRMQQKADNAAIDASLDDLDQRLQQKADFNDVQERMEGLDRRLQQKADGVVMMARMGALEQRVATKADQNDINTIKQEMGQKVDAAFVAAQVSANQVYIMQEVETMNITQHKQVNCAVVGNGRGPGLGSIGGSGNSAGSQQSVIQETRMSQRALPLANSASEAQAPTARAGAQRALVGPRSKGTEPNKANGALQPQPQLQAQPHRRNRKDDAEAAEAAQKGQVWAGTAVSRASSVGARQRSHPALVGTACQGVVQQAELGGRGIWRPNLPDERARGTERLSLSNIPPMLQRGDVTPPRHRTQSRAMTESPAPSSVRGRKGGRSRSATPHSDFEFDPKLVAAKTSSSALRKHSPRVWGRKRTPGQ